MNFLHTKKFRHGSISLALTVVIIAAVILINAIFTALTDKYLWYIDMTPEPRFTLSDEARALLDEMDDTKEVRIILCDEKDAWELDTLQLEVLKTVLDIEKDYKNVKVEYVDIYTNPSAVDSVEHPYREQSGKNITTQSVIVTCGSSVRVFNLEDFFAIDDDGYVSGYDGEQTLVSALLSVTQANAPVVCLTVGHGEVYDEAFTILLSQIGFEVKTINLLEDSFEDEEFKACRLLVISDPLRDFAEKDGVTDVSEIDKIEAFLDKNNSMMVFFDKDTPQLTNLETYLKEWGIEIARTDDNENTVIRDDKSSLTTNGFTNKAVYAVGGTGAEITAHMREESLPKTVAFPNTTSLRFSEYYKEKLFDGYRAGSYTGNVRNRTVYNVFHSSETAVAMAGGSEVSAASADYPYTYMMLSCESRTSADSTSVAHSFVLASASTDFASAAALGDRYGNRSVLSYACNTMGSLVVPVSLDCKYYASMEISSITASAANQYTVILTVIPASLVFIAGIYVMIRRKHA